MKKLFKQTINVALFIWSVAALVTSILIVVVTIVRVICSGVSSIDTDWWGMFLMTTPLLILSLRWWYQRPIFKRGAPSNVFEPKSGDVF